MNDSRNRLPGFDFRCFALKGLDLGIYNNPSTSSLKSQLLAGKVSFQGNEFGNVLPWLPVLSHDSIHS